MPAPHDPRNPSASWIYRLAAGVAFLVMRLQRWRFDVQGTEHLPAVGGAVIAANHTSYVDFFTSGRHPYLQEGRPVRILAKASLFRTPIFGWLMRRAEHIPVHRGAGSSAFHNAVAALQRGELVLVLPEQTISPSFELLPFRRGAARMAIEAGVPLIPTISWGTHRFHTVGRRPRWSWKLPVSIRYGEPLTPGPDDDPELVLDQLRRRMGDLLDQAQREYADGAPAGAWWVPARRGGGAPTAQAAEAQLEALRQAWRTGSASSTPRAGTADRNGTRGTSDAGTADRDGTRGTSDAGTADRNGTRGTSDAGTADRNGTRGRSLDERPDAVQPRRGRKARRAAQNR